MDLRQLMAHMEYNARAIEALVQGAPVHRVQWRPEPDAWSVVDVVNHLAYEEVHDFRDRLDLALHRPEDPWPKGDPARGVTEVSRQGRLEDSLRAFLSAREESLMWLRALDAPDWDSTHRAPFGEIRAGDILSAWVAHDLLHLRQLVELRWGHVAGDADPYGVAYAGEW